MDGIFKSLLRTGLQGSARSSALAPLNLPLLFLLCALIYLAPQKEIPREVIWLLCALVLAACGTFFGGWIYLSRKNVPALRSESAHLKLAQLERAHLGDSSSGLREIDPKEIVELAAGKSDDR